MDLLYLGYFCEEKLFDSLVAHGSKSSHARQQFETNLIDGLQMQTDIDSLYLISYLPQVKSLQKKFGSEGNYKGLKIKYLWCNKKNPLAVIKTIVINLSKIFSLSKKSGVRIVVTYGANPLHIIPVFVLKKLCGLKIISICSEISMFRRKENIGIATKVSRKISGAFENGFDGYILLTEYMNEIINKKKAPFLVLEGMVRKREINEIMKQNAVLYAGGLTRDNGIDILLKGFRNMQRQDIKLWICGDGPLENEVKGYESRHENIHYWGLLDNEKVWELEQRAIVLVNPRYSQNDFTKYSFPSKTLEYMLSGTPVIITRLKGIPEEYFKYTFILENETAEGLKEVLENVCNMEWESLIEFGKRAREFVLKEKNAQNQCAKIVQFLREYFI